MVKNIRKWRQKREGDGGEKAYRGIFPEMSLGPLLPVGLSGNNHSVSQLSAFSLQPHTAPQKQSTC